MSSVPATTTSNLVSPLAAGPIIGQDATDTVGFYGATGAAQGATVADPVDLATALTAVAALIDRLQAVNLIAS